jgi:hypothetical protein
MEDKKPNTPANATTESKSDRIAQYLARLGGHKSVKSLHVPDARPVQPPRTVKDANAQ